jgi:acyl-CoA synthetase (AMP-forming)/AMP-acid ligase II
VRNATVAQRVGTFVDALQWRAQQQPEQVAFEYLPDGGSEAVTTSYAQLDSRARAVAADLQALGAAGQRALLLCPPGLDFIAALFGCFYAGWVAVPAYPLNNSQQLARLSRVVSDARPAAALTTASLQPRAIAMLSSAPEAIHLQWLTVDTPAMDRATAWQETRLETNSLAILQYTSGSTDAPRGVMLSHANLLHNTRQIERRFGINATSRGVIWLPPYHDMGLVGGILQGIQAGFPIALMPPSAFLRRPARWLEAVSSRRATISGGPNFAYELCVQRVTPEERKHLDLSSWEVAFNGAEPVRAETIVRFAAAFAASGFRREAFYPCYGLAEATLMVTGGDKDSPPSVLDSVVGCGSAIDDEEVIVVDPLTRTRCADGSTGEVWVRGPSVAQGYWNQPHLTRETFHARLAVSDDGPYLQTGDLGFIDGRELYIVGRLKSLLLVGGRKLHAEDIERTVAASHGYGWPGGVAAVSVPDRDRELLVVLQEVTVRERADLESIVRSIRLRVAQEHRVPVSGVALLRPGNIPRGSSGKVRRLESREALEQGSLEVLLEYRLARHT